MLKRVLIANRGEIALRIIRGCHELDVETVAVYSEADRFAPFARAADFSYEIGPPPAAESYLRVERILEVAARAGADAVHPGYGFLAENADFAEQVTAAGLVWIGPPAAAIRAMGDKLEARRLMSAAGVPITPGADSSDPKDILAACRKIGFPVLVKAAAGGGGKGMRIVHEMDELESSVARAQSEAEKAFADRRVYVEKYIERPRHVEVQVMADTHGNVVHLGERECSIQRRYQKIIEEAPSPAVDDALRARMGEAAVRAARECGYASAGTVEFLLDTEGAFYFLEMNTRLQVEHPVTEMVTGFDLVHAQLRIAAGEKLPWAQSDVSLVGHAFECRIYAEDPDNNFMPSVGRLTRYAEPGGPGVRVDSGVEAGNEVSLYYDPQLAKLVVFGPTREQARRRTLRALAEYDIGGVRHNIPLLRRVLDHPEFVAGNLSTHFLSDHGLTEPVTPQGDARRRVVMAAAIYAARQVQAISVHNGHGRTAPSRWRETGRRLTLRTENGR